ncbi:MAG: carbohydrate ABC transporter permease [Candidatus Binatia bacterium]
MTRQRRTITSLNHQETRAAWCLISPALGLILVIALLPLLWSLWDSLHVHDLRMPWRGRPFVWFDNYLEALTTPRFWSAVIHTGGFTLCSVTLELLLGLGLALMLDRAYRGRGLVRAAILIPWAMPTVVVALVWRFLFESPAGIVDQTLVQLGVTDEPFVWFSHNLAAWVPIVLADVWKTTPFVALLLLAGLQNIDESLYQAARLDGASAWQQFFHITLPLLQPALLVALIFRSLDAFRIFDLVYVLTNGGPGTATEPLALYAFGALFQKLRFGFGAALAVIIFACTFVLALVYIRILGKDITESSA